ncbi:uncharacterized protein TNCV_821261 [Trichonephila clavipes]|nr:uncharacterized protein TNCV_821261 [Trichonephila clavipes]
MAGPHADRGMQVEIRCSNKRMDPFSVVNAKSGGMRNDPLMKMDHTGHTSKLRYAICTKTYKLIASPLSTVENGQWVALRLGHWTPYRKAWVQCPMPSNTLREHTENVLVKSVGPKVLWAESRVQGTGEYFPPIQCHGKIMKVDIGGGAIFRPFGESLRAKTYFPLYGAQGLGQRQA